MGEVWDDFGSIKDQLAGRRVLPPVAQGLIHRNAVGVSLKGPYVGRGKNRTWRRTGKWSWNSNLIIPTLIRPHQTLINLLRRVQALNQQVSS